MPGDLPKEGMVARLSKPGGPFVIEGVRLPVLRSGEALLQVEACTICASDLRTFRGERAAPSSGLLGHEIVGRIVAGKAGAFSVGDRVVCGVAASCGACRYCERGIPQKCCSLKKFGHAQANGGWQLSGGFAEYCHLPAGSTLVRAPESLTLQQSAWLGCAGATAAAATRIARNLRDREVLIMGAGAVGLFVTTMAREQGAKVLAVDTREDRLALSRSLGAEHTHAVEDSTTLKDFVMGNTGDRGADVVFETSGARASVEMSLQLADIGGRIILVGSVAPTDPVPVRAEKVVTSLLRIEGVHNYIPEDLVKAVECAAANQLLGNEIASRFPFFSLTDINSAFDTAQSGEHLRVSVGN
ncbi:MAG: alcohol dehydrogenase [Verrucomicrobiales bacterium]|nr:alcohol dehydrogenase [Verrucomicrobiales bacterium]|tara:strand:- start:7778 stop:8848 length:1071 start_codon:yes stop_codon:yes gene_type:complete